ncbi:MAG: SCP2 sterol-binding domain-containing protein [Proteobacteria bacterium]|nr:SCP2 sterol-binding domain-containing protein [Pseudomonadota bacterium]
MPVKPGMSKDEIIKTLEAEITDVKDKKAMREAVKDASPEQTFETIMAWGYNKRPDAKQKLAATTAIFQFCIIGETGGDWQVKVDKGALSVEKGKAAKANCTITMAINDWKDMSAGKLDPQAAFMAGKIKFAGDMSLAMKLGALLQ